MAAPGVTALIDPLSPDIDLQPFFALMANEKVTKVFHAARQDIEIIFHLGGLIPHPVFDTQVAAMVCGFGDSVSYDQLVQKITGAQSRQVVALHRLAPPAAVGKAARICAGRRHPSDRRLQIPQGRAGAREPRPLAERGNGGADLARDLRSASGGRLEAAEDAHAQAGGAGRPAGGRGMARARGARAQRAARPRHQGRRDLRDRAAAAARRDRARAAAHHAEGLGALGDGSRAAGRRQHGADHAQGRAAEAAAPARRRRKARTPPPNC